VLEVGQVIGGRLRVDRILGVGGFGVVAAATHLELQHQVAIKMCRPEYTGDEEIVERLLREARAVAGLTTDHVCRVFDVGRVDDGTPYIVMELLHGSDVASLILRQPLPAATAVDYIIQACIGLDEAHARNIIHRDLKPPNLWVTRRPDGSAHVKVLDFGIAKATDELRLTHSMVMLGSPQYMSPEQLTSPRDVDARTDIWSLGVTLYHMLVRRLPFPSAQIGELAVMITHEPPKPLPELDPALADVLFRCMRKDRAQRYQTVGDLAAALAPFGGPTAHAHLRMIRSAPAFVAAPPAAPSPAIVARHAPTVGSGPRPTVDAMSPSMPPSMSGSMSPSMPSSMPSSMSPSGSGGARPRSRALVLATLGIVLVGAGVLVGVLATRGSASSKSAAVAASTPDAALAGNRTAPFDAAVAGTHAEPVDAAVVARAEPVPAVDAGVLPKHFANDPEGYADYRRQFARLERTVALNPDESRILFSAVTMACILAEADKARAYFAKLADAKIRQQALDACKAYDVVL
jgi:serine/threonine-protein kinase